MIESGRDDAIGQTSPFTDRADGVAERYGEETAVRTFDGRTDRVTEMDALGRLPPEPRVAAECWPNGFGARSGT